MENVFLSLGSNLGDREENLRHARAQFKVLKSSNIYESVPWYAPNEPLFLNQCIKIDYHKTCRELLEKIHEIEKCFGRKKRHKHWGKHKYDSRIIDIDILYYGSVSANRHDLKLPHPHLRERNFVLYPLAEIAPDFVDPTDYKTVKELKEICNDKHKVWIHST